MAWPYTGTWTGNAGKLAYIMAALCVAVNERLAATNQSTVLWWTDDALSTTEEYPEAADFRGAQINGPCVEANLALLQEAVTDMADSGDFYETDAFSTAWTLSNLLTDVDMGAFATPTNALYATEWIKLRECLDRLIYYRVILEIDVTVNTIDPVYVGSSSVSLQDSWDDLSISSAFAGGSFVHWRIVGTAPLGSSTWISYVFAYSGAGVVTTNVFSGTVLSSYLRYSTKYENTSSSFIVNLNGNNITVSSAGSLAHLTIPVVLEDNVALSMEITTSTPATVPFSGVTLWDIGEIELGWNDFVLELDLSSALTDQA